MKKRIVFLFIPVVICVMCIITSDRITNDELEYYTEINSLIKDMEFYTANIEETQITFFDDNNSIISTMHFDFFDPKVDLIYIRKEGDSIFFIINANIDDESGVVFMNGGSDYILNGIVSLKRVGGNSYQFDSR